MRLLTRILLLGAILTTSLCGCATYTEISYKDNTDPSSTAPTKSIAITYVQSFLYKVALVSHSDEARPVTVLSDESLLTDAQGRQFRLQFTPAPFNPMGVYEVEGYGPIPKTDCYPIGFAGVWTIKIVYMENGERRVAQTTFEIRHPWHHIFYRGQEYY